MEVWLAHLYFGENAIGHVRFKTEKYDEETLFDISEKDVCIQVEDGEIIVHPPVLKWKIDNNTIKFANYKLLDKYNAYIKRLK